MIDLALPFTLHFLLIRDGHSWISRLTKAPPPPPTSLSSFSDDDDDFAHEKEAPPSEENEALRRLLLRSRRRRRREGKNCDLDDDDSQHHIWNVRVPNLPLNRTRVGPSLVEGAGRGLFVSARGGCREGDVLTCYPGDGLIQSGDDDDCGDSDNDISGAIGDDDEDDDDNSVIHWGSHVREEDRNALMHRDDDDVAFDLLDGYVLRASDSCSIVGLPTLDSDPAYLGHLANDGARPRKRLGGSGGGGDIAQYVLESDDLANAMHVPWSDATHMVTVATRDIAEGEEVLVTYGPEYWMGHPLSLGEDADDDETFDDALGISCSSGSRGSSKGFG